MTTVESPFDKARRKMVAARIEFMGQLARFSKEELKQAQIQLIDVPLEIYTNDMTDEELNQYFNSPKVNKKYRVKR